MTTITVLFFARMSELCGGNRSDTFTFATASAATTAALKAAVAERYPGAAGLLGGNSDGAVALVAPANASATAQAAHWPWR